MILFEDAFLYFFSFLVSRILFFLISLVIEQLFIIENKNNVIEQYETITLKNLRCMVTKSSAIKPIS